jgi:heterodisulfide reductase subunit D
MRWMIKSINKKSHAGITSACTKEPNMADIDLEFLREELLQCRRCGICRDAVYAAKAFDGICPVWKNTSGFETSFMRGKIQVALALLDGGLERTEENASSLYQCTLCGNCNQICPAEFHPAQALEQVREVLNDIPNTVRDSIAERITRVGNPYSDNNLEKMDWLQDLDFHVAEQANVLYYVGCTAGMRIPKIATDTANILNAAPSEFAVLRDEPCCGSVMLRTGKVDEAEAMAKRVEDAIRSTGAKKVVVSCAGCLKTLRVDYPERFGIELPEVLHIVEYADELIQDGKIEPKPLSNPARLTYHDPCHIGREMGIYDSPRNVLESISGIELVEMETTRNTAICCGAGGGLRSYDSDTAKKIGSARVRDAENTGAEKIVSACPFCEHNLKAGKELIGSNIDVVDVVDLLVKSLE